MSDAEKYTYYWEQARPRNKAMTQSTDPDEIARLAGTGPDKQRWKHTV